MPGRVHLRRVRDHWWLAALAVLAVAIFVTGFVVRLSCLRGECVIAYPTARFFDIEAVGGLPRLFTSAVFAAVAARAWRVRPDLGRRTWWWMAVGATAACLAVVKLVSANSRVTADLSVGVHLGVGFAASAVVLGTLRLLGRRWAVPGSVLVVLAMGGYVLAALGLDAVTTVVAGVQSSVGPLTRAGTRFVEELGEALTALAVLAVVHRYVPRRG